ncbi:hypothetical protein [Vibrio campbellii]
MLYLKGELRKVISFNSKKGDEFYKLKIELEHFDVEVFLASKLYEQIEEVKNMIGSKVEIPVYLKCVISDDNSKVYQNYSTSVLPILINKDS